MDFTSHYLSDLGRSAGAPAAAEVAARERVLGYYLRGVLPAMARGPACDVGCGRGETLSCLRAWGFAPVHGCDIGAEQVAAARAAGLEVAREDAVAYLGGVKGQALIAALDVIEHLDVAHGEALLRRAHAALRPGGWLVLQFPNAASPFFGSVQFADPTHQAVLTPAVVLAKLRKLGFAPGQALETGPVPSGLRGRARHLLWRGVRGALRAVDAIETGCAGPGPFTRVCLVVAQRP